MEKYTLLSIRPKYIKEIMEGDKKYEFRKRIPNFDNSISKNIIIYASKPEMKIKDFILYDTPIALNRLREINLGFVPGQSYRFLKSDSNVIKELKQLNPNCLLD